MLRIGISASFLHRDPEREMFKDKTLLYMEESLCHWVASENVITYLIPTINKSFSAGVKAWVNDLDGLVLHGGSDVCPKSYGEQPLKPEWNGDYIRDQYEIELINEFISVNKPILGVCRGAQIMNVALGGTMYQDIETQVKTNTNHRNWDVYEHNIHNIKIVEDSGLSKLYNGLKKAKVNSIHHQALKDLGKNLKVEAYSEDDNLIEAIRYQGKEYLVGLQWHPEFQDDDSDLIGKKEVLREFINEIKLRRK